MLGLDLWQTRPYVASARCWRNLIRHNVVGFFPSLPLPIHHCVCQPVKSSTPQLQRGAVENLCHFTPSVCMCSHTQSHTQNPVTVERSNHNVCWYFFHLAALNKRHLHRELIWTKLDTEFEYAGGGSPWDAQCLACKDGVWGGNERDACWWGSSVEHRRRQSKTKQPRTSNEHPGDSRR